MTECFRGDQTDEITGPDPDKDGSYADHIVHARGKRSRFTSVSDDATKVRDFGETLWRLKLGLVHERGHGFVEHESLISALRAVAESGDKADRQKAIVAQHYARRRREALVDWRFIGLERVERKDRIAWAGRQVQEFFSRVRGT